MKKLVATRNLISDFRKFFRNTTVRSLGYKRLQDKKCNNTKK